MVAGALAILMLYTARAGLPGVARRTIHSLIRVPERECR
jgi:hypothetical protein